MAFDTCPGRRETISIDLKAINLYVTITIPFPPEFKNRGRSVDDLRTIGIGFGTGFWGDSRRKPTRKTIRDRRFTVSGVGVIGELARRSRLSIHVSIFDEGGFPCR